LGNIFLKVKLQKLKKYLNQDMLTLN
jgi:hypothetical protein